MATLNEFMSNMGMEAFVGHHIGDGGLNCDTATQIGYTIDTDFGITCNPSKFLCSPYYSKLQHKSIF